MQETVLGRRTREVPANPPAYGAAYGVLPGPRPGFTPQPNGRVDEIKERYLGPGPGPCMIPETVITLDFKEVFAEDDSTKTHKTIHDLQDLFYTKSKWCLYNTLSAIVGFPISIAFGLISALVMFTMVWIVYPIAKLFYIAIWPVYSMFYTILHVGLLPFGEAMGRCVRHIQVTVNMKNDAINGGRNNSQPAAQGGGANYS